MKTAGLLGTLALCWTLTAAVPAAPEVPDLIESGRTGRAEPMWRSAAILENEQGIRWELFDTYEEEQLRRRLDALEKKLARQLPAGTSKGGYEVRCLVYGPVVSDMTSFQTLRWRIRKSTAIYSGTVLASKEGFLYGNPGTLYEIAVYENLMPGPSPSRLFTYYPASDFRLGDHRVCKQGIRHPERPHEGGEILIFVSDSAAEDAVLHPSDSGLFFQLEDGSLSVPPKLRDLEGIRQLPLSEIRKQVKNVVDELDVAVPSKFELLDQGEGGRP